MQLKAAGVISNMDVRVAFLQILPSTVQMEKNPFQNCKDLVQGKSDFHITSLVVGQVSLSLCQGRGSMLLASFTTYPLAPCSFQFFVLCSFFMFLTFFLTPFSFSSAPCSFFRIFFSLLQDYQLIAPCSFTYFMVRSLLLSAKEWVPVLRVICPYCQRLNT